MVVGGIVLPREEGRNGGWRDSVVKGGRRNGG